MMKALLVCVPQIMGYLCEVGVLITHIDIATTEVDSQNDVDIWDNTGMT